MADETVRIKAHTPSVLLGLVAGLILGGRIDILWMLPAAFIYAVWWKYGGKGKFWL